MEDKNHKILTVQFIAIFEILTINLNDGAKYHYIMIPELNLPTEHPF